MPPATTAYVLASSPVWELFIVMVLTDLAFLSCVACVRVSATSGAPGEDMSIICTPSSAGLVTKAYAFWLVLNISTS